MIIFPFADSIKVDSSIVYDTNSAYNFILEKIENSKYSEKFADNINAELQNIIETYGITLEEHKENLKNIYDN